MVRGRQEGLDALRGIAAALVVAYHLRASFGLPWLFPRGYLAVDFFFMLSGYVMARTYEARLRDDLAMPRFVWIRLKRLWPTMAAAALCSIPALMTFPEVVRLPLFLAALFFIPVMTGGGVFPLNNPQWSILSELFANAMHATVFARFSIRSLLVVSGGSAIVCAIAAAHYGWLGFGADSATFWASFPRVLMSYCLGAALWRLWSDIPPLRIPPWLTVALMPMVLALPAGIGTFAVDLVFVLAICPLLIAGGLTMNAGRVGHWGGSLSFPLYAFHMPAIWAAQIYALPWIAALAFALAAALTIVGAGSLRGRIITRMREART